MKSIVTYNYPNVGPEPAKHHMRWLKSGIYRKYLSGVGLDIGYGKDQGFKSIHSNAVGLDLGDGNYNGITVPPNMDFIFSSHMLEHVFEPKSYISEWFHKVKQGGFVFIVVPSMYRYERRKEPPSRWNADHKRFYTPARLLSEIEASLSPNSYQIVHFRDNCDGYDYSLPLDKHPVGEYDIEVCIKKL